MAVTSFQDLPLADRDDRDRIKSHLAKYSAKLGETPPWE